MKIDELMIGDLISMNGVVRKVTSIHQKETENGVDLITTMIPGFKFPDTNLSFRPSYAQPIPLTPDILEKNWFLQNGIGSDEIEILDPDYSDETYVWQERDEYDNLFTVSVYNLNDGIGNWSLEIVDSPKGKMELEIKYVHELQRALRICGIEKEIIVN